MSSDLQKQLSRLSKRALRLLIESVGLRKKYREVLIYKYVDELSNYDIGVRMGYTADTVANLLCKARKQLKHILEREKKILPENIQYIINLLESEA